MRTLRKLPIVPNPDGWCHHAEHNGQSYRPPASWLLLGIIDGRVAEQWAVCDAHVGSAELVYLEAPLTDLPDVPADGVAAGLIAALGTVEALSQAVVELARASHPLPSRADGYAERVAQAAGVVRCAVCHEPFATVEDSIGHRHMSEQPASSATPPAFAADTVTMPVIPGVNG